MRFDFAIDTVDWNDFAVTIWYLNFSIENVTIVYAIRFGLNYNTCSVPGFSISAVDLERRPILMGKTVPIIGQMHLMLKKFSETHKHLNNRPMKGKLLK